MEWMNKLTNYLIAITMIMCIVCKLFHTITTSSPLSGSITLKVCTLHQKVKPNAYICSIFSLFKND